MEPKFTLDVKDGEAKIELCGRLDAVNAPQLQEELKKMIGSPVKRMVFLVKDLEYISSAGLRVIIFAKQKVGVDARVFFVGAQEAILNVIKMSGLDNFLTICNSYDEVK
ncbi:MAG: STAS domain-containing protein [Candidatus Omnitrophota bacterium]